MNDFRCIGIVKEVRKSPKLLTLFVEEDGMVHEFKTFGPKIAKLPDIKKHSMVAVSSTRKKNTMDGTLYLFIERVQVLQEPA